LDDKIWARIGPFLGDRDEISTSARRDYRICDDDSFLDGLEEIEADIARLKPPRKSAELYETFLAGCYAKADEVDDSFGGFAGFIETLYLGWIRARQKEGYDPQETVEKLLKWKEDDQNGFAAGIEGLVAKDCATVASLLKRRGKAEDALEWVERGCKLSADGRMGAAFDLERLRGDLLVQLGRGDEALSAAFQNFEKHPSVWSYEDLMQFVTKAERKAWHDRALVVSEKVNLRDALELCTCRRSGIAVTPGCNRSRFSNCDSPGRLPRPRSPRRSALDKMRVRLLR